MFGQQRAQRDFHLFVGFGDFGEYRRFMQGNARACSEEKG